jgi:hypothetical protein
MENETQFIDALYLVLNSLMQYAAIYSSADWLPAKLLIRGYFIRRLLDVKCNQDINFLTAMLQLK